MQKFKYSGRRLRRSLHAISPVIAILLIIVITVAASLVAYAWVMGYLSFVTSKVGNAVQVQSLAVDNGNLVVYVQNVGQSDVEFKPDGAVYVNDELKTILSIDNNPLEKRKTATIIADYPVTPDEPLKVKIVTIDGTFAEIRSAGGAAIPNSVTLNVHSSTGGSVTVDPDQSSYTYGTEVTLTAIPEAGYEFQSWSGDLTGNTNPTTIIMNGNKDVTANFDYEEWSYTELWSNTFTPSTTGWQTRSLSSYGVPANSVAIIHIYNDHDSGEHNAGVRATGSSLNRYLQLHEAEGGGLAIASMMVQVDESQNIQIFSDTTSSGRISFRVIGYFTGVGYTERFDQWTPTTNDAWTDKNIFNDYGVPKGTVIEVFVAHRNQGAERWMGIRTDGSALNRRYRIHETEGGGIDGLTMNVKTDFSTGAIEYYSDDNNGRFYLLGYFTVNMDYVERTDTLSTSVSDSWRTVTLNSAIPANSLVEVMAMNENDNYERYGGVRSYGLSLNRRVAIHEAEAGGWTGGRWTAESDSSRRIQIYKDHTSDVDHYLIGYWAQA